ncbi:MAG: tetratricopeptide repeat protein, partial [bacterium]|nr:tetratricopeptide repeat protein [bacterium]
EVDPEEIERLEGKLTQDPNDLPTLERLGHLYLQENNFEKVFETAHQALQTGKKSPESFAHMGIALFAQQDSEGAMRLLDKALELNPNHPESLFFKGMLYMSTGEIEKTKETWKKFVKVSPPGTTGLEKVRMFLENQ